MPEAEPPTSSSFSSSKSKTANPIINQVVPPRSKHPVKSLFNEHDNDWPTVDLGNLITDLDADIKQTASPKMSVNNNNSIAASPSANSGNSSNLNSKPNSNILPLVANKISVPSNSVNKIMSSSSSNIGSCLSGGTATATITESRSILEGGNEKGLKMKIKRNKTSVSHGGITCNTSTSTITSCSSSISNAGNLEEPVNVVLPPNALSTSTNPSSKSENTAPTSPDVSTSTTNNINSSMQSNCSDPKSSSQSNPKFNTKPQCTAGNNSAPQMNNSKQVCNGDNSKGSAPSSDVVTLSQATNHCSSQKGFLKIDASVGTEMGTMTEPDCLGPLDPGTSVTLEGIVWHETEGGVLVINVTWRGKTYVGTLLDSTQHVNQWAPPRYSESPTAEIDNKKGRGNKRSGRPGSEPELTRKNLRSSKGKPLKSATNSPSKRKKGFKDEDSNDSLSNSTLKRQRTSSKNNSADENEDGVDSEREGNGKEMMETSSSNSNNKEHNSKDKDNSAAAEEEMTPKDPKEVKYIPPPPLPYALTCPSPGCKKRYRQHNGLRFHISHSHKELLDSKGDIRDTSDIDKCEKEAKERLKKRGVLLEEDKQQQQQLQQQLQQQQQQQQENDLSLSKSSTPALSNVVQDNLSEVNGSSKEDICKSGESKSSELSPMETEPIVSTPSTSAIPTVTTTAESSSKPLSSVRPLMAPVNQSNDSNEVNESQNGLVVNHSQILSKDDTTNTASPASNINNNKVQSLEESKKDENVAPLSESSTSLMDNVTETSSNQVKSPAYSDISDDGGEDDSKKNGDIKMMKTKPSTPITNLPPSSLPPSNNEPIVTSVVQQPPSIPSPAQQPSLTSSVPSSSNNHFPFAPYIPSTSSGPITTTTSSSFKPEVSSSSSKAPTIPSLPGTSDYQKMLQAYGFPQFPPYPPGFDPILHLHMMNSDPSYKAKFEKERSDKKKAHFDREQREKDCRRSVGITPPPLPPQAICKAPEDLRKPPTGAPLPSPRSMISVKPEFNVPKSEPGRKTPQTNKDEGAKPTMETRGPPPANINPYGYLHPSLIRPPVGISYEALAAAAASGSINPLLLSPNPYMPNPYLPPHMSPSMRPPYGGGAPDLLRGSYPQGPEDLSRSVSVGPPSGGSNSSMGHVGPSSCPPPLPSSSSSSNNNNNSSSCSNSNSSSSTKALDLLQQHASQYYSNSHKIHELSDRGMKSPSEKAAAAAAAAANKDSNNSRKRTPSPATGSLSGGLNRSRSPPPLRHVHTHTHTHFGLGYPLLHPPGSVPPPAAHTPFSPGAYPSHLLPPSGNKGSLPSGPLGQSFPPPPK